MGEASVHSTDGLTHPCQPNPYHTTTHDTPRRPPHDRQVMKLQDSDIKAGRIEYETGSVEVEVAFTVLLFRPFRNEIIDATVTTVTEVRPFDDGTGCIGGVDW